MYMPIYSTRHNSYDIMPKKKLSVNIFVLDDPKSFCALLIRLFREWLTTELMLMLKTKISW